MPSLRLPISLSGKFSWWCRGLCLLFAQYLSRRQVLQHFLISHTVPASPRWTTEQLFANRVSELMHEMLLAFHSPGHLPGSSAYYLTPGLWQSPLNWVLCLFTFSALAPAIADTRRFAPVCHFHQRVHIILAWSRIYCLWHCRIISYVLKCAMLYFVAVNLLLIPLEFFFLA